MFKNNVNGHLKRSQFFFRFDTWLLNGSYQKASVMACNYSGEK